MEDGAYMNILAGYTMSIFQDFEISKDISEQKLI